MPIKYLRNLTSPVRTERSNRHLGVPLAFVAGATNAGGFLAVGQYTSHMTGIISTMADNIVLGDFVIVAIAFASLIAFLCGAATSAILINWSRRRKNQSEYAFPLFIEALLLLFFGLAGANLHARVGALVPITILLLCFIMGLQNAIITKISSAVIRTTHVTGLITDIGIELGKLFYWNRTSEHFPNDEVRANRKRLKIHSMLVGFFFFGGLLGAISFKSFGFISVVPLAVMLLVIAVVPVFDDLTYQQ
ncbi:MAG: DUF1275 domain-containing protein [Chlorobiales bacterium]|jgi:uncharacterized membrane protein YoaK (UPF0700 family)|nr:DUF1275 domain-containing protein [Chlorobiales bacterium]